MIKFTILFLLSFIFTINSDSNKNHKYSSYHSTYADRSYFLNLYGDYTDDYTLYIEIMSFDAKYHNAGLILHKNQINNFITALDSAKKDYNRWKTEGLKNKGADRVVRKYYKEMIGGYFNAQNKTKMRFKIQPKYEFRVLKNKNGLYYTLNISTGKMRTRYRQYYTTRKFAIIFTSIEEIDDFINKIKLQNINDYLLKKPLE